MPNLQPPAATLPAPPQPPRAPGVMILLFGVLLPLITLGVELTTGMNAAAFFDPLPSIFHIFLVGLAPLANFAVWLALRRRACAHLGKLALANGCAIGVALFYSILFLPLLPIGAVAVVYFGIGLLPLTPLITLIAAIRCRVHLARFAEASHHRARLWPGVVLGVVALIALDLPASATRLGMQMASAETPQTRAQGVRWLQLVGKKDLMLRLCYMRSGVSTDMLGFVFNMAHPISAEEARKIYFRVTGNAFNSLPAPAMRSARGFFSGGNDFDFAQGGDTVGGKLRGLSLGASRMDASLDANAAVGYIEWTMVFKNDTQVAREARAQIGLPPGASVSRLTLWINGEEREAAFAGRGKVREAYQNIVRQNRDPVLVTSAGQDRVSMQLFPVPVNGEMKVRLGITVPLTLKSKRETLLSLPYFHERNFDVPQALRHALWVEAKTPLRSELAAASPAVSSSANAFSLRANVEDARLATTSALIFAERGEQDSAWALDSKADGYMVRQRLSEVAGQAPKRLVVVIDGSIAMRAAAVQIAEALASMPRSIGVDLVIAAEPLLDFSAGGGLTATAAAARIEKFAYAGGNDNVEALARGFDLALTNKDSALLWIHGPQPVLLETAEALLQRLERRVLQPLWYEWQVQPGANLIAEKLDGVAKIRSLNGEDLKRLIATWQPGGKQFVVTRERINMADAGAMPSAEKTSDHLVRLWANEWANDEILKLLHAPKAQLRENVVKLAQLYQLVTPVSGAVVLETQQQYDAAGLEPVASGSVPTIPEPETWALIAVVLFVLAYAYQRRRRLQRNVYANLATY